MKTVWRSSSETETRDLGAVLAARLQPDGVLLLRGALGVGKTVLAQGIARGLGIDPRQVQSPSFTLVREHFGGGARMIHIDLYRLDPSEVEAIGIWEILESPGVKIVEWSERLPVAPDRAIEVEIRLGDRDESRVLTLVDRSGSAYTNKKSDDSATADARGDIE